MVRRMAAMARASVREIPHLYKISYSLERLCDSFFMWQNEWIEYDGCGGCKNRSDRHIGRCLSEEITTLGGDGEISEDCFALWRVWI